MRLRLAAAALVALFPAIGMAQNAPVTPVPAPPPPPPPPARPALPPMQALPPGMVAVGAKTFDLLVAYLAGANTPIGHQLMQTMSDESKERRDCPVPPASEPPKS